VKINGNHLIATLTSIEASCAAVRMALEALPDPASLVIDYDVSSATIKSPPHFMPAGACNPPVHMPRRGDPVEERTLGPTSGARQGRRRRGSQPSL
jgi:hypothetical protein